MCSAVCRCDMRCRRTRERRSNTYTVKWTVTISGFIPRTSWRKRLVVFGTILRDAFGRKGHTDELYTSEWSLSFQCALFFRHVIFSPARQPSEEHGGVAVKWIMHFSMQVSVNELVNTKDLLQRRCSVLP